MDSQRCADIAAALLKALRDPGMESVSAQTRVELYLSSVESELRGSVATQPVPMLLWCPECCERHIDVGEFATKSHHTHACQNCGHCWRPAVVATVGVRFLPGFKNEAPHG